MPSAPLPVAKPTTSRHVLYKNPRLRYCAYVEEHHPDWFIPCSPMHGSPTWRYCETVFTDTHGEAKFHGQVVDVPTGSTTAGPPQVWNMLPKGESTALQLGDRSPPLTPAPDTSPRNLPTGMPSPSPPAPAPTTPSVLQDACTCVYVSVSLSSLSLFFTISLVFSRGHIVVGIGLAGRLDGGRLERGHLGQLALATPAGASVSCIVGGGEYNEKTEDITEGCG